MRNIAGIRLKVNRAALIAQTEAALGVIEEKVTTIEQEQNAWDWRVSARQGAEQLIAALDDPETTEKSFDSLWYDAKRDKPSFFHEIKNLKWQRKRLRDLRDLLRMNSEELVTVSTADEAVQEVLRRARQQAAQK